MSIDPATFARLREIADELSALPAKPRVEIGPQGLVMMTSPTTPHGFTAMNLARQVMAQTPDMYALMDTDMQDAVLGRLRVPDVMVLPEDLIEEQPEEAVDPRAVALVIEVVSRSNPENDHRDRIADYSAMGIPLYLIVDPGRGTAQVLEEPDGATYRKIRTFDYGQEVPVGRWLIDTGRFPRYR
ncbi:Uma2 family endonuclease [Streptomyces sp. NRRL B-24484]|uniref:Uma2 family endonuclease n=1 Tax=Streptomyces sp. NRRL B-24484 TaxID=1463833 RepID=UPI000996C123|nr:Uma2 family endonuclease [Streptomyces sp. NRRL B-24484]